MPPWQGGGNMIADVTFENRYQGLPNTFPRRAPATYRAPWAWARRWSTWSASASMPSASTSTRWSITACSSLPPFLACA
ncbi:MAG: hypothetical protein U1E77_00260 [Inhella sp.]